jgi:polyferredoxin/ferredoxin
VYEMKIVIIRRVSQLFFLALFIGFCVVSTLGTEWWQLRGWPVNWFFDMDPLVAIGTLLATQTLYAGLLGAAAMIVLTILFGRFFCGWVCPFGTIHHFVGHMWSRTGNFAQRIRLNRYRPVQTLKYYILIFLLTAAAGGTLARLAMMARNRPAIQAMFIAACFIMAGLLATLKAIPKIEKIGATILAFIAVWTGFALFLPVENLFTSSLQSGLLDPIPLLHRSINLTFLPLLDRTHQAVSATARNYEQAGLIGFVFLAAIFLNFVVPRFYCRFLCPLGALLGAFSRYALWRVGKTKNTCSLCKRCETDCEGACEPAERIHSSECVLCMNCLHTCEDNVISYRTARSASGEQTSPDLARRGFILSLVSGLVAIPLIRLSGALGMNWNPRLIRPPGSLSEEEFLKRCLKCGQCMRICPTNIIQPAGPEMGFESLWTPALNFRIGAGGCRLNCVACGNLCPTAAIRPISLDEKLGRGKFEAKGPVRLGTAFVDQSRCLPWSMDMPCIVCQENCPVSPKAIHVRDVFLPIREELPPVAKADELSLDFGQAILRPGQFSTGDYFCRVSAHDEEPRRIVDNTVTGITIGATKPWDPPPKPGRHAEILVRLQRPVIDPALCIGCGICEHECPITGIKAIRVTAENESRNSKRMITI